MDQSENETKTDCPFCEGAGEERVFWSGQEIILTCEECRGTGEAVELVGEGLPEIKPWVSSPS